MGTFDSVYLNKIRQLEEENQQLRNILNEYKKPKTRYLNVFDMERRGEYIDPPTLIGTEVTKQGNPVGKGARQRKVFAYDPEYGSEIASAAEDADLIHPTTDVTNNPVMASKRGVGPAIPVDVTGRPDYGPEGSRSYYVRRKGGSVPGTGKKAQKRELAIELEKIRAREAELAAELAKHEEG